jgi:transposase
MDQATQMLARHEAEIATLRTLLAERDDEIIHIKSRLLTSDLQIEKLRAELAKFKRLAFGKSSEKIRSQIEQLELALEELETTRAALPTVDKSLTEKQANPTRKPLPEHLPKTVLEHLPETGSCACPACGGTLRSLGSDEADELDIAPVQFRIVRHVRPKFACASCQKIVQAPAPERAIEKGRASPNLLAHVLAQDVLFTDDTPVPVLAPGAGKTKIGRLWTHVTNGADHGSAIPSAVWFAYSADRKGEHPRSFLGGFKGHLHTDGFAGYTKLFHSNAITMSLAGLTHDASFTICMRKSQHRRPKRHCAVSANSMRLRKKCADRHRRSDWRPAKQRRLRDWIRCING